MTIQELQSKYYFHDSCITEISYNAENKQLCVIMDFCQWQQEWYDSNDPENILLKLSFEGIKSYDGPLGIIDYFSILDTKVNDDSFLFNILDDINDKAYQIILYPSCVQVENLGIIAE